MEWDIYDKERISDKLAIEIFSSILNGTIPTGLSHQKQPYPMAGIHVFAMESLPYFYEQAWDLWHNRRRLAF